MPRKPPRKTRTNSGTSPLVSGGDHEAHAPHRLEYALEQLTPSGDKPGCSYSEARDRLVKKFGVSKSTASADLTRAYAEIRARLEAADMPSVIRTEMEGLARRQHEAGDRGGASLTWFRLGRLSGMGGESDEVQARKLSDQALNAAIAAALALRVESMSTAELEDLLARRKAQEGKAE